MFQNPADGFCADRAHGSSGSPKRRRQRRLRSWLRHERQTVALELAAALHHSRDVGPGTHASLRAQKAASSGEVEAHETHSVLRGPKQPPPGERPGILAEPGPERSDRSRRHSSGDYLPTLALPVLAWSAGEAVDACSLRYLSAAARLDQSGQRLQQFKEEEQEWENRPTRRKKKRKKKKLPRGRDSRGRAAGRGSHGRLRGCPGADPCPFRPGRVGR